LEPNAERNKALHSGKQNHEVQLCAFDVLAIDSEDLCGLHYRSARRTLSGYREVSRMASSSIHSKAAPSGVYN
jgi:ATP-dependent DNA ligase